MISLDADNMLVNALAVIDEAYSIVRGVRMMAPLFSGGHDSYCACFVASQHRKFDGNVYHIDTSIGSKATRAFVEQVCKDEGWKLNVLKSPINYEQCIRWSGFPGPAGHRLVYNFLKDRCIRQITKHESERHHRTILISGMRSAESSRRMAHGNIAVQIGVKNKTGKVSEPYRIWTAPCHNWSSEDQINFMNYHSLLRNPVKESVLGMSGECFCGAFARPYELDMIRRVCPDVAIEIYRLQAIARECGKPCIWGRPPIKGETILETGPLCTTCDNKAQAAGLTIIRMDKYD